LPFVFHAEFATRKERAMSNIADMKCTFFLSAILAMLLNSAWADSDFPIEGVYTQNEPCRGDGSKQEFLRVKISSQDVSYAGGICSIDSMQQDADKVGMKVTCRFKSGAVMSSTISFTKRDADTLDMAQQGGTYKAVLHRCVG
jgi:hypothetical protein